MAVPEKRVVEAVVVASGAHDMALGDTCLTCGQSPTEARCEPETFDFGPPAMTVRGEVVSQ